MFSVALFLPWCGSLCFLDSSLNALEYFVTIEDLTVLVKKKYILTCFKNECLLLKFDALKEYTQMQT